MLIFPAPWEGLHPAFSKKPEPFNSGYLPKAFVSSGLIGSAWGLICLVRRRNPAPALRIAAWSTIVAVPTMVTIDTMYGRWYARPYLESKGIQVPPQKLIQIQRPRTMFMDEDTFILAGGIANILLATISPRLWPLTVTGWKRYLGAFSIGAFLGDIATHAYHHRHHTAWRQQRARDIMLEAKYKHEVEHVFDSNWGVGPAATRSPSVDHPLARSTGRTPLNGMRDYMQRAFQEEDDEASDDFEDDMASYQHNFDDPRPHLSTLQDGEHLFMPQRNPDWSGSLQDIDAHITHLRTRRDALKTEAEYLFHRLAIAQGEQISIESHDKPVEKDRITESVLLSQLHFTAYMAISQLDWLIADSQKLRVQIRSLNGTPDKTSWTSSPTPTSDKPHLKHALQTLNKSDKVFRSDLEECLFQKELIEAALKEAEANFDNVDEEIRAEAKDASAHLERQRDDLEHAIALVHKLRKEFGGK